MRDGTTAQNTVQDPEASRTLGPEATAAAFLLGGIGAGNVSLGSRGELRDWEIFNRPAKGYTLPNTWFAIRACARGTDPVTRVLQSPVRAPHIESHGYHQSTAAGLPHVAGSTMLGEYPIVWVTFEDPHLPVQVCLEAYTPLIPLNAEDSGLPGAYLTYTVSNASHEPVDVSIVGSILNPVGSAEIGQFGHPHVPQGGRNRNVRRESDGLAGLYLHSERYGPEDLRYGDVALAVMDDPVTCKPVWHRGSWAHEALEELWNDFSLDGRLEDLSIDTPSDDGKTDTGSVTVASTIAPGESRNFRFVLAWYFPNRINGWNDEARVRRPGRETIRNHYATRFDSSWEVARYLAEHRGRLERETRAYRDALFQSTLPAFVIDAVASNVAALRSTTCFWLEDGRFLGWEGCFDDEGCCPGTCTHVWNYAQTAAFLFPELERSMRRTELQDETEPDGKMNFRALKIFESVWDHEAAADGQLGTVMRVYREWRLSGDDSFLRAMWPSVQAALRYAVEYWDTDNDLILDGRQHNTYDIEFYGPNPLTGVFFLGALRSAEEIACYLGDDGSARRYAVAFARSAERLDALCWNGEYYEQRLDDVDAYPYQHGTGCLSDQLLGQQMAHLLGLGHLLPREHVRTALESIYHHNYLQDFTNHVNTQRTYVLNDEAGLLVCSWPRGGRPRVPFPYSDEVFTGIEYQVATHLIYEGLVDEGLTIVRAVRARHDGVRRNPWNEVECGNHYARSMASWGLLPALGTYAQRRNHATGQMEPSVRVLYGDASGVRVRACGQEWTL